MPTNVFSTAPMSAEGQTVVPQQKLFKVFQPLGVLRRKKT